MLKWFSELFKSPPDEIEERIKKLFSFLLSEYNFHFEKENLGNAINKEGKIVFYGPLNAYSIYNENVCINILYLVQRQDYEIYITDSYKNDQVYIRSGARVSDELAYDLDRFASEVKNTIANSDEIYGRKI